MTDTKYKRESWDFSAMEPDQPVIFTIVFDRNERDDGSKQDEESGELRQWHKMVCKVEDKDYTVFTPSDQFYDNLMTLDLNHKGQTFTVTKKGVFNKTTKKWHTEYEITSDGTVLGAKKPESRPFTPPSSPSPLESELKTFEGVAVPIWDTVFDYCIAGSKVDPDNIPDEEKIKFRLEIVKASSTMVNTAVIQNGGKR